MSRRYLTLGDIWEVEENGVAEYENKNLTRLQMKKELYTIMCCLWDSPPCPICLEYNGGIFRKCRGCGHSSCHSCFRSTWYHFPVAKHARFGIEDKRCNLCFDKCSQCEQIYPYTEGHKCL